MNESSNLASMMISFSSTYEEFGRLFDALFYLFGFIIPIGALLRARAMKEKGYGAGTGVIISIFVGSFLVFIPSTMDMIANTFMFSDCRWGGRFYDYIEEGGACDKAGSKIYFALFGLIKLYGFFAVLRGFYLINENARAMGQYVSSRGDGSISKGLIHIGAGFLCVYMLDFFRLIDLTFGTGIYTYFGK